MREIQACVTHIHSALKEAPSDEEDLEFILRWACRLKSSNEAVWYEIERFSETLSCDLQRVLRGIKTHLTEIDKVLESSNPHVSSLEAITEREELLVILCERILAVFPLRQSEAEKTMRSDFEALGVEKRTMELKQILHEWKKKDRRARAKSQTTDNKYGTGISSPELKTIVQELHRLPTPHFSPELQARMDKRDEAEMMEQKRAADKPTTADPDEKARREGREARKVAEAMRNAMSAQGLGLALRNAATRERLVREQSGKHNSPIMPALSTCATSLLRQLTFLDVSGTSIPGSGASMTLLMTIENIEER